LLVKKNYVLQVTTQQCS